MKNWYGIPNIKFLWHGEWADPEIEYKGYVFNSTIVEDTMWERFREENENFDDTKLDDDAFDIYMRENAEEVYELCDLVIENMEENY